VLGYHTFSGSFFLSLFSFLQQLSRKPPHLISCRRWFLVTASERKKKKKLMVALSMLQDTVVVELKPRDDDESVVDLGMKVVKRREPLKAVTMAKAVASGQQSDGTGILIRLLRSDLPSSTLLNVGDVAVAGSGHHWTSLAALSLCGCGLSVSVAYSLMELSLLWYLCYLHFMVYSYNCCQVSFVNLLSSSFRN